MIQFSRIILLSLIFWPLFLPAQTTDTPPSRQTAEEVARELYDLVTFGPGQTPDWDVVRSLFIPEAVIVLRTTRTATQVFTVDGFVQDFINYIERAQVEKTGFEERVVRVVPMEFGEIAHVLILYEAHIPGSPRAPQQGVDSFHLIRREGRWWIASIVNEIPTAERPLPAVLQE